MNNLKIFKGEHFDFIDEIENHKKVFLMNIDKVIKERRKERQVFVENNPEYENQKMVKKTIQIHDEVVESRKLGKNLPRNQINASISDHRLAHDINANETDEIKEEKKKEAIKILKAKLHLNRTLPRFSKFKTR